MVMKRKLDPRITTALVIGFMIGIVVWSVFHNTLSLLTLIPLYIVYRLVSGPRQSDAGDGQ